MEIIIFLFIPSDDDDDDDDDDRSSSSSSRKRQKERNVVAEFSYVLSPSLKLNALYFDRIYRKNINIYVI
jgi:hypothetical protein